MNTRRIIGIVVAFMSLVVIGCSSGKEVGGGGGSGSGDVPVPTALVAGDVIRVTLNGPADTRLDGTFTFTIGASGNSGVIQVTSALETPFNTATQTTYTYTADDDTWTLIVSWLSPALDSPNNLKATLTMTGRFGEVGTTWELRRFWATDEEEQQAAFIPPFYVHVLFNGTGAEVTRTTP